MRITDPETLFGYHVQKSPTDTGRELATAYHLSSPRGVHLALVRTIGHPTVFFAMSAKSGHVVPVGGHYRFTDRDGSLQPLS